MGIVLLDLTFRVERAFKIHSPKGWHEELGLSWKNPKGDVTVRQYHEYLLRLSREQHVTPPAESWRTLVDAIIAASGMNSREITSETRLIADIAPGG